MQSCFGSSSCETAGVDVVKRTGWVKSLNAVAAVAGGFGSGAQWRTLASSSHTAGSGRVARPSERRVPLDTCCISCCAWGSSLGAHCSAEGWALGHLKAWRESLRSAGLSTFHPCRQQQVAKLRKIDAAAAVYPVSVVFEPAFDMFTHLVGAGERQSGWDVSAALTTHGSWQPSVQPSRRPSLADAVVGSLGISPDAVLVDVGAGYGFFSLAAAARGHRVHAFELAPASLDALEASIDYNGFKHLIEVRSWRKKERGLAGTFGLLLTALCWPRLRAGALSLGSSSRSSTPSPAPAGAQAAAGGAQPGGVHLHRAAAQAGGRGGQRGGSGGLH